MSRTGYKAQYRQHLHQDPKHRRFLAKDSEANRRNLLGAELLEYKKFVNAALETFFMECRRLVMKLKKDPNKED